MTVSAVSVVSENPLQSLPSFSSRAHFAKTEDSGVGKGGSTQWRITDCTDDTDRWHLICRLLADPEPESRRLAALLERWPAERRRHVLSDDAPRRFWSRT